MATRLISKLHAQPQIDASGGQIIWNGVLLVENGFDPSIAGLVLYLHKVEDFETEPAGFGEAQGVQGAAVAARLVPESDGEPNVHPMIWLEAVGIAKHFIVAQ